MSEVHTASIPLSLVIACSIVGIFEPETPLKKIFAGWLEKVTQNSDPNKRVFYKGHKVRIWGLLKIFALLIELLNT